MDWKDKNVLITGGTGSFGKKFIEIMLKEYHPLFVSLHFIHPNELTPECAMACERLADADRDR